MTREKTQEILMSIQAAYPNYKPQDKTVTVNTWTTMLQDYTYEQVMTALKAYISTDTSGFAPSIGQLIDKMHMLNAPQELNEMEAWALVSKALRNGSYGAEQEFEKLPPLVQKAVGAPSQLRNWALTDMESVENVIQSNFMRTYRAVLKREQETSKLPSEVKQIMTSSNLMLEQI